MNRAIYHGCHDVDKMCDTRVRFKCATGVRLCAARAVHVRHPFTVSAHVRDRLEKLRHLASVRLTCMYYFVTRFHVMWKQMYGNLHLMA